MKRLIVCCSLLLLSLSLALTGCQKPTKTDKPVITVSIEPQLYFTRALARDYFDVVCMVPRGSSPETYDPIPRQLVKVQNSLAYFRIGYIGFEQMWMGKISANAPHIEMLDTSKDIRLLHGHHDGDNAHAGVASDVEPHVWCSVGNARIIARNTYHFLSSLDRNHDKIYRDRFTSLMRRIDVVDSTVRQLLSAKGADKVFAIYHPTLSYFARDYGLQQIAIENNGKEPSPSELKAIIDRCKASKVRVVFVQPEFDRRNAEIIARQIGARVISINPLNAAWDTEMIAIAKALGTTTNQ
jgi:zinc transport system substrate-binding protein